MKKSTEPTFAEMSASLATADSKARELGADANQAKAERSTAAIGTIRAAFSEKINSVDVRNDLIGAGVLKGTVSKIVTILTALQLKTITLGDVKSLNGAYTLVKAVEKAGRAAATTAPLVPGKAAAPVTTPEEALKLIIAVITAEKDPDKALRLGGEWITRITNAITDALKEAEDEEGED